MDQFEEVMKRFKDATEQCIRVNQYGNFTEGQFIAVMAELRWALEEILQADFSKAESFINRANARMN